MLVYRIGSSRYPANDGRDAAQYGGRWNHKGTPLIYAAESRALCALEILAGGSELANDCSSIPIEVPDDIPCRILSTTELPEGWNSAEHSFRLPYYRANLTTCSIRNIPIFRALLSTKPRPFTSMKDWSEVIE